MANETTVEIGFVNIVATPHPAGIYNESLAKVANKPVNVRGKDWAIITKVAKSKSDEKLFRGSISVWTDIDASEPSIDKSTFRKQDVEAALAKIFAQRGFNNRTFDFVLDEFYSQGGGRPEE